MDRVETLLQKLQEQVKQGASPERLLVTVQMMQHELQHLQSGRPVEKNTVTVSMPVNFYQPAEAVPVEEPVAAELPKEVVPEIVEPPAEPEKIIEVLQIDEAEVEAELEEIRRNAALMQQMGGKLKPSVLFDLHEDEVPTLAQQEVPVVAPVSLKREINDMVQHEANSVNDLLKSSGQELSHKLTESVKDLKKAIGLNDRFLYINELFRGDEAMYERSIKTINSFAIFPEAEYWIRRELKTKLGWVDADPTVMQFDQLVKRRFA